VAKSKEPEDEFVELEEERRSGEPQRDRVHQELPPVGLAPRLTLASVVGDDEGLNSGPWRAELSKPATSQLGLRAAMGEC
jgi:hypothetical protein